LHTSVSYGGFCSVVEKLFIFIYMNSIHFSKAEKAWNRMEVYNLYIHHLQAIQAMYEYPAYLINVLLKIAVMPHFQCHSTWKSHLKYFTQTRNWYYTNHTSNTTSANLKNIRRPYFSSF